MEFQRVERKWQDAWATARLFEASPDKRKKFFITTPYPYISGSLHLGHGRAVTETDVYARFLRMCGHNVLFPMAFHISGMPVLGIATAIEKGDLKRIALYTEYVSNYVKDVKKVKSIVASFKDPQKIVDFFVPYMISEYSRMGLSVDWRRKFTSGDVEHQKLVEWQFRKYKEKELLVKGKHPVLYSLEEKNAMGEDDIADGDTDPVEKQEFTLLKFKFGDGFIVAATLRPETMFGQTNMWVHPDIEYVKADVNGEVWYVSAECMEKLRHQDHVVKKLGVVKGRALLGKYCTAPFLGREIIILPSLHCDGDIGTGCVTSVPSDAPFDFVALRELQNNKKLCEQYGLDFDKVKCIELIPIIASKGYGEFPAVEICKKLGISNLRDGEKLENATQEIYKAGFHTGVLTKLCGKFAGLPVAVAKEKMKSVAIAAGDASVMFETSRKAVSRSGGKIIVAVLDDQWFLDFNHGDWKKKAEEVLHSMSIVPEKYVKQFEDVFAWLDKRPCVRRRGLGTQFPFDREWVIESLSDSTIYMSLYTVNHLIKEFEIDGACLNELFFDFVMLGKGDVAVVAKETGVPQKQLEVLRAEFDYWYGMDHRHTFTPHLSNHLSFMIFAHAGIFPKKYWPKKISFHGLIISGGQKMSKSKGNVIPLPEIYEKYGADAFRALMCSSASIDATFNFEAQEAVRMREHLNNVHAVVSSIVKRRKKGNLPVQSRAFMSRFERAVQESTTALEKMDLRTYANNVLYGLFGAYKKLLRVCPADGLSTVHDFIGECWVILLTPLVPHLAEELWGELGGKGFVSVAPWPSTIKSRIDVRAEYTEELISVVGSDVRTILGLQKLTPKKVTLFVAEEWKFVLFAELKKLLEESRDVGSIMRKVLQNAALKKFGKEVSTLVPRIVKDPSKMPELVMSSAQEKDALESFNVFLEKEFSCSVVVIAEGASKEMKAKQALPGKPAIVVE